MNMRLLGASCVLAMTAMFTPAHAAVTFDDAYVSADANAAAIGLVSSQGSYSSTPASEYVSSFTAAPLVAEAYATATVNDGFIVQAAATDNETATASFISPLSGSSNITGATSAIVAVPNGYADAYESSSYSFYYDFDVTGAATFNLNYVLSNTYLGGYSYGYELQNLTNQIVYFPGLSGKSGSVSYQLTPGKWEFETFDGGYNDTVVQDGIGSQTGNQNATFSFSISGAPEPSIWALTIVGVGLVGGALRYGRRGSVLYAA